MQNNVRLSQFYRTLKVALSCVFLLICGFVIPVLSSCTKNTTQLSLPSSETVQVLEHAWYYFADSGFVKTDLPQNAPTALFKPWTEAPHVTSSSLTGAYAYFLVNRIGLIRFNANLSTPFMVYKDKSVFAGTTAENLFSIDGEPVFNVYRSSFFNDTVPTQSPFLVQFRPESGFFIPILAAAELGMPAKSQPVSVMYDGKKWATAFKSTEKEKIVFNYLIFSSPEPLLPLLPTQRKSVLLIEPISADTFKELNAQKKFSDAPQALKQLLTQLPKTLSFQIECLTPDSGTPKIWVQQGTQGNAEDLQAQAIVTNTYSLAIFKDGTSYFAGSLPEKYTLKNGKTVAFRLPKLPVDFGYSHIAVCGSMLYASWEETRFYETGRSGFLTVDLAKVLY